VICHPKLVGTGLDLLDFPTIIFYESGYSLHTLRQASRRSWRIGQRRPVRVKFLCAEGTMQTSCLRLMGKKLLVALTMEGKFAGEGLHSIDEDDDMLSAMARELVERNGIGETADAVWRAPHVGRLFQRQSSQPKLLNRDAVYYTRGDFSFGRKTLQLQGSPNFQGTTEPCSTSLGVHQNYQACSENGCAASRLERVTGISQPIRVPRWTDFWLENELNSKFNNS